MTEPRSCLHCGRVIETDRCPCVDERRRAGWRRRKTKQRRQERNGQVHLAYTIDQGIIPFLELHGYLSTTQEQTPERINAAARQFMIDAKDGRVEARYESVTGVTPRFGQIT